MYATGSVSLVHLIVSNIKCNTIAKEILEVTLCFQSPNPNPVAFHVSQLTYQMNLIYWVGCKLCPLADTSLKPAYDIL